MGGALALVEGWRDGQGAVGRRARKCGRGLRDEPRGRDRSAEARWSAVSARAEAGGGRTRCVGA